ncbi:MAG: hypothetical protein HYW47_03580 [Deltaproteobacteria bacterium]|nr:hypothetical protein [Deltaproteobacteria bacterium]
MKFLEIISVVIASEAKQSHRGSDEITTGFFKTLVMTTLLVASPLLATPPLTRVHISQEHLSALVRYARNEALPEIDVILNPRDNLFTVRGKAKINLIKLIRPEAVNVEYENKAYPEGIPFEVSFKIEVLPLNFILLSFHRLQLFEGESTVVFYDKARHKGVLKSVFGFFQFFVEETKFRNLIVDRYEEVVLREEASQTSHQTESLDNVLRDQTLDPYHRISEKLIEFVEDAVKFKFKAGAFIGVLPHSSMSDVQVWNIEPIINTKHKFNALEVVLGLGSAPLKFLDDIHERRKEFETFSGWMEEKENPINFEQTISLLGLNNLMASFIPLINNQETLTLYEKGEASKFNEMSLQFNENNQLLFRMVTERKEEVHQSSSSWNPFSFEFWSGVTKIVTKEDILEIEGRLKAQKNNIVELELVGGDIKGFKFGKKTLKFFQIFADWIIPWIDDPKNDNEVLNKFVKIRLNDRKNLEVVLNSRMFSSAVDIIFYDYHLDFKNLSVTLTGEALFKIGKYDQSLLADLVDKTNEIQEEIYSKDALELNALLLHSDFTKYVYNPLIGIKNYYPKSTTTGLEAVMFVYTYSKLVQGLTTALEKLGADYNLSILETGVKGQKLFPLLAEYKEKYHRLNQEIIKEKTFWNALRYEDALQAEELYEASLRILN